jgi:predicted NAD/FAD-binding protein
MSDRAHVTVAGGGLAGITAALRLAERGYGVTLYEQKPMLGGDLASRPGTGGVKLDVYPHMYLSWYGNFWRLLKDAGGDRSGGFEPLSAVKQLRAGKFPHFDAITDLYSPAHMLQNLFSGVGPPADMFVFGYAGIDLLAEKLNPTMLLEDVSVTGFLQARPYMTERASKAFDSFITMVWAIPSYLASADDYRDYLAYSFADHSPAYSLAIGSAYDQVIGPLQDALERHRVEIRTNTEVTRVRRDGGRVVEIGLRDVAFDTTQRHRTGASNSRTEPVDELVLAVPPDVLLALARTGSRGERIIDVAPRLSQLEALQMQRIPIVHLYFNRVLPDIPREPVGLFDSPLALAFTDISQTWRGVTDFGPQTVLSVSASNPYGLPGTSDPDDGYAIVAELARYLRFDPGTEWGTSPDVDWAATVYEPNRDVQLFLNQTGTDVWRPQAVCTGVDNVVFAGDFCANDIGMTTIESAVAGGLEAARVVVGRRGGAPVEIAVPAQDAGLLYVWLRYMWGPYALAAKAWSTASDWAGGVRRMLTPTRPPPAGQRRDS